MLKIVKMLKLKFSHINSLYLFLDLQHLKNLARLIANAQFDQYAGDIYRHLNLIVPCREIANFYNSGEFEQRYAEFDRDNFLNGLKDPRIFGILTTIIVMVIFVIILLIIACIVVSRRRHCSCCSRNTNNQLPPAEIVAAANNEPELIYESVPCDAIPPPPPSHPRPPTPPPSPPPSPPNTPRKPSEAPVVAVVKPTAAKRNQPFKQTDLKPNPLFGLRRNPRFYKLQSLEMM